MLTRIDIADYQSLRRATIPVGRLTVVTGPTGSGKSSVRRAGQLVALNARGTDYIRRGAGRTAVVLTFEEQGRTFSVAIRRTASGRGGDLYRVINGGNPQEYTKLGGQVPEEVQRLLRLSPLNFVGQLDPPYLLSDTGTDVARTLGDLTNVSLVFRAAAEAGRRRKGFDRDAKSADGRLVALRAEEEAFFNLQDQFGAMEQAEQAAVALAQAEADLSRLAGLAARLEDAQDRLARATAAAKAAEPPDLSRLEKGLARYQRLQGLTARLEKAEADLSRWEAQAAAAAERETTAHQALHDALAEAGQCPMCGQQVTA